MEEPETLFCDIIAKDENLSVGIAAIQTLMMTIESSTFGTLQELRWKLQEVISRMKATDHPVPPITSGCELFMRFITLIEDPAGIGECKKKMLERGELFLQKLNGARTIVAQLARKFILDGSRILTHSKSRVVLLAMKEAAQQSKKFVVYVTNADGTGRKMVGELQTAGICAQEVPESAIGYCMESVDFVMVGAESVVENGGIVNKIGTYPMAICAKEMNKPFYVLTESFKFSRVYILSQSDLPHEYKFPHSMMMSENEKMGERNVSSVDYTPPFYITLLFTDLGILTPSAVSDELIKLYL